jgi:hypothetical protein
LNDNIINGRIRGIAGVVGCNNARTRHNEGHIAVVKELIKNDVIVLTTGCNGIACAMEGLLTPETAAVLLRTGPGGSLRNRRYSAGSASGFLRGQQPDPAGGHRSGQGRRTRKRHQRSAGGRQRPGMDE